jgi:hypothetical protein
MIGAYISIQTRTDENHRLVNYKVLNFNIVESPFIKNKGGSYRRSELKTEDVSTKKQESKIPLHQTLGLIKNESTLTNTISQQCHQDSLLNFAYKQQSFWPSLFNQPYTNHSQMKQTKFHQPLNSSKVID